MSIVVLGSVALDNIKTPYESIDNVLGGSALHFSNAASILDSVAIIAVIGDDFPKEGFDFLKDKKVDTSGLQIISGEKTFHWEGYYEKDMNVAHTLKTDLNVFASFNPNIPTDYLNKDILFLANIDPDIQLSVLKKKKVPTATLR